MITTIFSIILIAYWVADIDVDTEMYNYSKDSWDVFLTRSRHRF